jgi:HAD superfamily hydrolase (TIGR01549 family)
MAPRALIFDLDGTLWDSYLWYAALLSEAGGGSRDETFEELLAGASIVSLLKRHRVSRARFASGAVAAASALPLYPDVRQVLGAFVEQNVPLAVFTALPRDIAPPLLAATALRGYFREVVHAGNCRRRKPQPHGLYQALTAIGVEPSESVVYVGDRDVDARTARNAGVSFAWAAYGYERQRPEFVSVELWRFAQLLQL